MPAIFNREVESYEVSVFRSSNLSHTRQISLHLTDTGSPQTQVSLHFQSSQAADWVQIQNGVSTIQLPLNRYDDMYHLLQTEKPVYFTAYEFGDLRFGGLTTDPEATGEGFRDAQAA